MRSNLTEKLAKQIMNEIMDNGYSIKSFSTKCEISYDEMRRLVNMDLNEPRLSTVQKICKNSRICFHDLIFEPDEDADEPEQART